MAQTVLPTHPRTGLAAVGTVNGRPVWPICGGDDSADAAAQAAAKAEADTQAAAAKAAADTAAAETGFPANTPVAEMSAQQQAAYWQDKARKHEGRVKALGNLTPEQLAELKEKADKADNLELDLGTDIEKASALAKRAAADEADAKYRPMLVNAEFKAAAAGRIAPDKLATILEPLDLSKFLAADGTPDTDKVTAYIDGIAPATGSTTATTRPGPSPSGQGQRGGQTAAPAQSVAAGRELYRNRRPARA